MSKTIDAIMERFSCRNFADGALSESQVDTLVKAALAAPSAMNMQPWRIVVLTNKPLIEEMDAAAMLHIKENNEAAYTRMMERGGSVFYNAPCIIYVLKNETAYATLDCGIATQNIALAAHALGLGSVICGMANMPLQGVRGSEFLQKLGFPSGFSFGMAVCVGKVLTGKEPHDIDMTKVTYIR